MHHLFENLPITHGHDHHTHSSIQSSTTSTVDHEINAHEHSASPAHAGSTHDDQNHNGTAQTLCLLQSAAQHLDFSTAPLLEIVFLKVESGEQSIPSSLALLHFNPSPLAANNFSNNNSSINAARTTEVRTPHQDIPVQNVGGSVVWSRPFGEKNPLTLGFDSRFITADTKEKTYRATNGLFTGSRSAGGSQELLRVLWRVGFDPGGKSLYHCRPEV